MSTTPSSVSRLQELLPQLFQSSQLSGKPYLRCQLTPEVSALISMEYVQESLVVPGEQITPIPKVSSFVIGLMNSRDRIFCAIDLPQLLKLSSPLTYSREYHVVVISLSQIIDQPSNSEQEPLLGLVVNQIQGITRAMSEEICSAPSDLSSSLTPYLQGWVVDQEQQLPVLDMATIVKKTL